MSAELEATCARCAEEFNTPSGRPFRFILVPRAAGDRVGDDLRAEDLEFSTYKGEDIDLSPLIREQLLLSLPTRPLCDESCRGLCPVCGINLNQAVCDCSTAVPNRRLEVLRSLKVQRPAR